MHDRPSRFNAMALARVTIACLTIAVSACAHDAPSGHITDRLGGWEACFLLDSTTSPFPEPRATCVPFRLSAEQACGGWVAEYVIARGWPEIDPTWQYDTLRVIYTVRGDTLSFGNVPPGVGSTRCEDEAAAGALFGTGTLTAHGNEWVGFWGLRNEYQGRTLGWFSFLRPGLRPGPGDP